MRGALVFLGLALAVAAAAVAASLVLLGSTGGNDRVGNLSPVARIAPAPRTTTVAPAPPATTHDGHGGERDD